MFFLKILQNFTTYNPAKHAENYPVRRQLKCVSKSEKKKFREAEHARFLKVLNKLNALYDLHVPRDESDTEELTATDRYFTDSETDDNVGTNKVRVFF